MSYTGEWWRVTTATHEVDKIPVPDGMDVNALPRELMADLSWAADQIPQYAMYGWWPVNKVDQQLEQFMKFGDEILVANLETKDIDQSFQVIPWTEDEVETYKAVMVQKFYLETKATIEDMLNTFAASRNYADITALCTYAVSTDEEYKAEGLRGVELRDQIWRKFYDFYKKVKSYEFPIPESIDDIELPELTWDKEQSK